MLKSDHKGQKKFLDLYKQMLRIRLFEDKVVELIDLGKMHHIFSYRGEEAIAVGVCSNLKQSDYITSTHRGLGHAIAKGTPMKYLMAELFGKTTGTNKGKAGVMLVADLEVGHLGGRGVVGAGVPIGTGAALSAKLRGSRQVCVSFFGDGASNQGVVHEAMNLAAVWKLPQVFVCENNQYGLATHVSISTSVRDISKRAAAYGMRGISINGMDVLAVDEAARESIAAARKGHGPSLIECKTYRYMGHSGTKRFEIYGKPYRSEKEIEQWMRKDPVKSFKARLIKMRSLTEERHEEMVKEIRKEIEEAVQFAIDSPDPKPEEALEGLFAT